jgi:hypothetical protein
MSVDDALRKIRLLRQIRTENGASAAEADIAARKVKALMERYTIKADKSRAPQAPAPQLTWVYWQELFNEFGVQFSHFGYRGSATLGPGRIVYIQLNTGRWWVKQRSAGSARTSARDRGVGSLRNYLKEHAARSYSLQR